MQLERGPGRTRRQGIRAQQRMAQDIVQNRERIDRELDAALKQSEATPISSWLEPGAGRRGTE